MKKWLLVSLLSLVCLTLVGSSVLSQNITLRAIHRPDEGATTTHFTEEFERLTGIKVEVDFVGWDVIHDKILSVLIAEGGGYDIVFIPGAYFTEFAATGTFEPLEILPEEMPQWVPTAVEDYTYEDQLLAIPWYLGGPHFLYNAKYLAQAGVDPNEIETWDDLLEACRKIKAARVLEYSFIPSCKYPGNWNYNWGTMTIAMGGRFFDEEMNPVFNEGGGLKALELLVQGVKEGLFDPAGIAMDDYETLKAFQAGGNSAFLLDSTWSATQTVNPAVSAIAEDVKIMLVPGCKERRSGGFMYTGGIGIMKSSPHKAEAERYIRFLTSMETQIWHAAKGANLPTRVYLYEDPIKSSISKEWPIYGSLAEQIQYDEISPHVPYLASMMRIVATAVQKAVGGKATAKEALDWAVSEVRKLQE